MTSEAETILKMIETVDPADAAKLDEVDCRVYCFVETPNFEFVKMDYARKYIFTFRQGSRSGRSSDFREVPYYTRSRDALKAIRPEGWIVSAFEDYQPVGWRFQLQKSFTYTKTGFWEYTSRYWEGPTEELAELHPIIQAIEYERRNAELEKASAVGRSND